LRTSPLSVCILLLPKPDQSVGYGSFDLCRRCRKYRARHQAKK
jgi:hypothetical protein